MTVALTILTALVIAAAAFGTGYLVARPAKTTESVEPSEPQVRDAGDRPTDGQLNWTFAAGQVRDPEQQAAHDDMEQRIRELNAALDVRKPAPPTRDLADALLGAWTKQRGKPLTTQWDAVAETASDAVRGLWPVPSQSVVGGGAGAATSTATPTGDTPDDTPAHQLAAVFAEGQFLHAGWKWDDIVGIQGPMLRGARTALAAGWRRLPSRPALAALLRAHDIDYIGFETAEHTAKVGEPIPIRCACGEVLDPIFHLDHVAEQVLDALTTAGATR